MTAPDVRPIVAVTRDERADDRFSRCLEAAGGRALPLATVGIAPPLDEAPLSAALSALDGADWLVFTSSHAVEAACGRPEWTPSMQRAAGRLRVAAVGAATAQRLRAHGVTVDLVPEAGGGARELVNAMRAAGPLAGARVVWPRSDIARHELRDGLVELGAAIVDPVAYRTLQVVPPALPEFLSLLESNRLAAVAFLAPSAALGLAAALPAGRLTSLVGRTIVATLGPATSDAVREAGGRVDLEAPVRTAAALADAIMRRIAARHGDAA